MSTKETENIVCPDCGTSQPKDASNAVCIACGYKFGEPVQYEKPFIPTPAPQPKPTPIPKPSPTSAPSSEYSLLDWLSSQKRSVQEVAAKLEHTPLESIAPKDRVNIARKLALALNDHHAPLTEIPLLYQKFLLTYHRSNFPIIPHRRSEGDGKYSFPTWKWLETYAEGLNPWLDRWLSDERCISEGRTIAEDDDETNSESDGGADSNAADSESEQLGTHIITLVFAGIATYFIWWIGIFAVFFVLAGFYKLSEGDDSKADSCTTIAWCINILVFILKVIGWIWSLIVSFFQWLF